jgi:hypothetical protein
MFRTPPILQIPSGTQTFNRGPFPKWGAAVVPLCGLQYDFGPCWLSFWSRFHTFSEKAKTMKFDGLMVLSEVLALPKHLFFH